MRIALINASPRVQMEGEMPSASYALLTLVKKTLRRMHIHDTEEIHLKTGRIDPAVMARLMECDVWLFSFPVYSFGIPSHLIRAMQALGEENRRRRGDDLLSTDTRIRVYAMAGGALFEGDSARCIFDSMEIWCEENALTWGAGIGVGGSPPLAVPSIFRFRLNSWRSLTRAVTSFTIALAEGMSAGSFYSSPNTPKNVYITLVNRYVRRSQRNAYGRLR